MGWSSKRALSVALVSLWALVGCYFDPPAGLEHDAGLPIPTDTGGGFDASPRDAELEDAPSPDLDSGPPGDAEAGVDAIPPLPDAEPTDVDPGDVDPGDVEPADAPSPDVPVPVDAEPLDAEPVDAEPPDAGEVDTGVPDVCGNAVINPPETCDDGNRTSGDGCESNCSLTPGFVCIGAPSFCKPIAETAVVDQTGPSCPATNGAGTVADPYCRIASGIGSTREFVFVYGGTYVETVLISDRTKTLIGDGATIAPATGRGLDIRNDAEVTVRGFVVRGISDSVRVTDGGTRATIEGNTLGPSGGYGVTVSSDGRAFVRGNIIAGNLTGGVRFDSDNPSELVNNIIRDNGTLVVTDAGGVYARRVPSGTSIVNNTIFDNHSRSTTGGVPGIRCDAALTIHNTIVWNNNTSLGVFGFVSANCAMSYSFIGPGATVNGTNRDEDPLLATDGHLSAGSPCQDAADPAGTTSAGGPAPLIDIDGDPRPRGNFVDVGADEL